MNNILPILFVTHNRTELALTCLISLCEYLINLKTIPYVYICDDRSTHEHVLTLENNLKNINVKFKTISCTKTSFGYGYVVNTALDDAFNNLGYNNVLMLEDDWMINKKDHQYNFLNLCQFLDNNVNIGKIRLSLNFTEMRNFNSAFLTSKIQTDKNFKLVTIDKTNSSYFYLNNLQCCILNKRMFKKFGKFLENCFPDKVENHLNTIYKKQCNDLNYLKIACFLNLDNSSCFIHYGENKSTKINGKYF